MPAVPTILDPASFQDNNEQNKEDQNNTYRFERAINVCSCNSALSILLNQFEGHIIVWCMMDVVRAVRQILRL